MSIGGPPGRDPGPAGWRRHYGSNPRSSATPDEAEEGARPITSRESEAERRRAPIPAARRRGMETPMAPREGWRGGGIGWGALTWGVLAMTAATAPEPTSGQEWPASGPQAGGVPMRGPHVHTAEQLLRLSPPE